MPLILAALVQGMPLNVELYSRGMPSVERVYEDNFGVVTTTGLASSFVPLLFWLTLYVWSGTVVIRCGKRAVQPRAMLLLIAISTMVASSALWSQFPLKATFVAVHCVGAILIAMAAALRYRRDPGSFATMLGISTAVSVLIHIASAVAFPSIGIDWSGRWTGLAPQPNTLGLVCLMSIWANLGAALMRTSIKARVLHIALACVGAVGLAGTNSITSSIAAVCVGALVLGAHLSSRVASDKRRRLMGSAVALCAAGAIAVVAIAAGWDSIAETLGRTSDATGRTGLWDSALELIRDKPVLGWGFDDNATVIATTGFPYSHFHNGLLDVGVKGGAVGMILVVSLLAMLVRGLVNTRGMHERTLWTSLLTALAVHNTMEVSLLANRNLMWIATLVAFVWIHTRRPATVHPMNPCGTEACSHDGIGHPCTD